MPEQSPVAPRSGDVVSGYVGTLERYIEIANATVDRLAKENEKLKRDLSDAQLTVRALDDRVRDLMGGER